MPSMGRNKIMKISQIPARRVNLAVFLLLLSFVPAAAQTPDILGGHIGLAFPLVATNGGTTTTIGQNFTIVVPVGISVKGPGSLMFDLEFEPAIQDSPRDVTLTISPGLLWAVGHGFSVGGRLSFVASSPTFGLTGVVIKSLPIENNFFKSYFVEGDLPLRFVRPQGGPEREYFRV
jgi:hypothetical protein